MFQRFMSPFREVYISLLKKICHHPKGKNAYDSTDPTGVSLQKVTSVAAQQLNQLAAVGHAAPWALKMVGWWDGFRLAAVMVGVGVMKHEIGTQFGVGSNNASYGNFEGFPL